jgi:hypothetical protein
VTDRPLITPETKVGALLDAYPELESVLIGLAPPFRKLKNPVLRRTVARLTSLAQAAKVGGVDVRDLVLTLRRHVGQTGSEVGSVNADAPQEQQTPPDWVDPGRVTVRLDADTLLQSDALPLEEVTRRLRSLQPAELLELRSSFHPAPLLDTLQTQGHRTCCTPAGDGAFVTFVSPKTGPSK